MRRTLQEQINWARRAQIGLVTAIAASVGLFIALSYLPKTRKLREIRTAIALKQSELANNREIAKDLPRVALEVDSLRKRLQRAKRIPNEQELAQFIRDVTQISQNGQIEKFDYKPSPPRHSEMYSETPILLSMEGDFRGIFAFLRQAEEMQRLTRVRSMSIKGRDGKDGVDGRVVAQVAMSIYFAGE
jgi:Tfp pilus assembly protein PilO